MAHQQEEEAAGLRALLHTIIHARHPEPSTASGDIAAAQGLARLRDAALSLRGAALFAKIAPAEPPLLYRPTGRPGQLDWELSTLPVGGAAAPAAPLPAAPPPAPPPAALAMPAGAFALPEADKGALIVPPQ